MVQITIVSIIVRDIHKWGTPKWMVHNGKIWKKIENPIQVDDDWGWPYWTQFALENGH